MSKCKISIIIFMISLVGLILNTSIAEADVQDGHLKFAEYQKIYPGDVSPKSDIVRDVEYRDSIKAQEKTAKEQKLLLQPKEKELFPKGVTPPLVGAKPTAIPYQISVNDKLYISVWRVPELSLEVIIGPDGSISFPLIGDLDAAGRTLSELDAEITEKLKEYVVDPQVSVMVREFAGDRLIVLGEVKSPGVYKFVGRTNIMNVIALAGGFTDRAKTAYVIVVRESIDPGKDTNLIGIHVGSILKEGNLKENIELKPDDIIYVSRTFVSHLKEFYDNWITPSLRTLVDYETFRILRRQHLRGVAFE